MTRHLLATAHGGAAVLLYALALSACASAAPPKQAPAASASPTPASAVHTGFVGYRWTVTAISDGGPAVAIPARYAVYLMFLKNGQFVANEPVNTHSGPYRVTGDGFTTADVATTLVSGGGGDPASRLAIRAIEAFSLHPGTHATADVTGNQMIVRENGFTLICRRTAKAD